MADGHFVPIKDSIRNPEGLRKWLVRLTPIHVYASVSCWLNPTELSFGDFNDKKAGYNHAQNVLIHDMLVFDTDFHDRTFEEAHQDALTIHDYLDEQGYHVDEVNYSGLGFHLIVQKHDLYLPRSYSSRNMKAVFKMYHELREPIVKELIEEKHVRLDAEVTMNIKSILRVVGSVNSKVPSICTRISNLERFGEFEAGRLRLGGVTPVTSKSWSDGRFSLEQMRLATRSGVRVAAPCKNTKPSEPNPETSTPRPTLYLGTFVIGTLDRQIVLLRFPQPVNIESLKERLSRFAESERLAPFLIFKARKDPDALYALSPSAIQFDGMKRLLRKFPTNNATLQKFKRRIAPFPIEPITQTSGVVDTEKPVSRAHWNYLHHYRLVDYTPKVLTGNMILSTPIGEMST